MFMAKVTGPLHSEKASGKLANGIIFQCGKFVRYSASENSFSPSAKQLARQSLFTDCADAWSNELTFEQRNAWVNFAKQTNDLNGKFKLNNGSSIFDIQIGEKDYNQCIPTSGWNGYQYFQSCFLRFGNFGWNGFPWPPPQFVIYGV